MLFIVSTGARVRQPHPITCFFSELTTASTLRQPHPIILSTTTRLTQQHPIYLSYVFFFPEFTLQNTVAQSIKCECVLFIDTPHGSVCIVVQHLADYLS